MNAEIFCFVSSCFFHYSEEDLINCTCVNVSPLEIQTLCRGVKCHHDWCLDTLVHVGLRCTNWDVALDAKIRVITLTLLLLLM